MLPPCHNDSVRRRDRLADETLARRLLEQGEYGFLALQAEQGGGYGVPVNFAWDEAANALYIHCAPQGRKLRCLAAEPRATFCIVGHTRPLPHKFTAAYESVLLQAAARTGLPEQERMHALGLILHKYCPDHVETGLKFAAGSFHRTEIIRLDLLSWSAKAKVVTC